MGWKRTKGCEGEQVAIGDGVSWTTPCKRKAKPEAQLGDRRSQSDEPRRVVGCGKPLTGGDTRGMKRTKKAATVGM